jgi:hypothetical protein
VNDVVSPVAASSSLNLPVVHTIPPRNGANGSNSAAVVNINRRVHMAVGSMARDIQVLSLGDRTVVQVRVDTPIIQDMVRKRLENLPEMAAPKVQLVLEVTR